MKNLETKNLILRKFELDDYKDMYNNWASDEIIAKNAGFPVHTNENISRDLVRYWVDEYNEKNVFNWIIILKSTNEAIGSITVVNKDIKNRTCEIGYNIGIKFWNNGYATESLGCVVAYLFDIDIFDVINANHHDDNPASSRVLQHNNFKKKGTFEKDNIKFISYSIEKTEYDGNNSS